MTPRTTPSQRLAAAIQARLAELGLTIAEWKRRSGVSDPILREMRDGARDSWRAPQERGAERGLGWRPQAFDAIRKGAEAQSVIDGQPTVGSTPDLTRTSVDISDLDPEQRAYVLGAVDALRKQSS